MWGLDLSQSLQGAGGIGGLVCTADNGAVLYYFYDANGNVGQLADASDGAVKAHYELDAFGNLTTSYGDAAERNAFRFSTKYFDGETGLYYYGYRYYLAELGRWVSKDPLSEEGGINLYLYILNNPGNQWDYLGLYSISEAAMIKYKKENPPSLIYDEFSGGPPKLSKKWIRKWLSHYSSMTDKEKFEAWYETEKEDMTWTTDLPDCPCTTECIDTDTWGELTTTLHGYHVGAKACMRSKPKGGKANQCCYDSDGKLITNGSGSGSADRAPGAVMTFFSHRSNDMKPADLAKKLDNGGWGSWSEKYLLVRPQVGSDKCPKNP